MDSTGCEYDLIKEVLKDLDGDFEAAIEYLISIKKIGFFSDEGEEISEISEFGTNYDALPIKQNSSTSKEPSSTSNGMSSNNNIIENRDFSEKKKNGGDLLDTLRKNLNALKEQEDILKDTINQFPSNPLKETLIAVEKDINQLKKQIEAEETRRICEEDEKLAVQLMLEEESQNDKSRKKALDIQRKEERFVETKPFYKNEEWHEVKSSKKEKMLEGANKREKSQQVHSLSEKKNENEIKLKDKRNLTNKERQRLAREAKKEKLQNRDEERAKERKIIAEIENEDEFGNIKDFGSLNI